MRVVSLGSGSSGNALLIEAGPQGRTRLLVDAGLSARALTARLQLLGVHPSQLQGVLITHEHSDHVLGLPVLMKRYSLPVIADPRTLAAIEEGIRLGAWRSDSGRTVSARTTAPLESEKLASADGVITLAVNVEPDDGKTYAVDELKMLAKKVTEEESILSPSFVELAAGSQRTLGDIEVTSFPISHDAIAPCGYLLRAGGCRVCIVTDSGEVTPGMLGHMSSADLLILESNHDRERLIQGPYSWSLKKRILSSTGHLSNEQAADAVLQVYTTGCIRWLWLAHLSRTNNTPDIALRYMQERLLVAGVNLSQLHIVALPPGMGTVWDSTQLWNTSVC